MGVGGVDRAKLCPSIFAARRQFDKLSDDGSLRYSDTNQQAPFAMSFARRVGLTGSHKFCHDMPAGVCMCVWVTCVCTCVCAGASRPCLEILIKSDDIASNSISECRLLILRTFPLLILCQYYIEPIIYTLKGCVPSQWALSLTPSLSLSVFLFVCVSLWHVHCLWITNLTLAFIPLLFRYSLTSPLPLYACAAFISSWLRTGADWRGRQLPIDLHVTCKLKEFYLISFSCFIVSFLIRIGNILLKDVHIESNSY